VTAVDKDYTLIIILEFDTVKPHPGHNSDNPVGNRHIYTQSNAPVALPSIYSSKIFEPIPDLPTATRIDSKATYQDVLGVDDDAYISPTSPSPPKFFTQEEDDGKPEATTTITKKGGYQKIEMKAPTVTDTNSESSFKQEFADHRALSPVGIALQTPLPSHIYPRVHVMRQYVNIYDNNFEDDKFEDDGD